MCGIAGAWGLSNESILGDMLNCIYHRGPDEEGRYINQNQQLMMGARRLSIVDLEGGSQPIYNEDNSIAVTFNGEIYNHSNLRALLKKQGHQFSTNCDTEVLVHLWEEHGENMPEYLNGMFAFAIWDENKNCLFLARDRMGIKPLYYADTDDGFSWSSELGAILKTGVDKTLDQKAIYNYFNLRYWPWPQTPFESISKVPPGTSLLITKNDVSQRQYWELEYSPTDGNLNSLSSQLRSKLEDSVSRRLMSDVPLGAFLSGGLDSSSIVGIMSELSDNKIKTFSVGFENNSYDESDEAAYVADYFGTDHHELTIDLSSVDLFEDLISYYGEPLADPAMIPTLAVSRYASKEVKVVLTGEGADELFGGYWYFDKIPNHQTQFRKMPKSAFRLAGLASQYSPIRRQSLRYFAALENNDTAIKAVVQQFGMPVDNYTDININEQKSGLQEAIKHTKEIVGEDNFNKRMETFDLKYYLPDNLLYKVDHTTMAASLEARVPFLDHDIVEFAYGIPHQFKKDGYKPVLNSAVDDLVPKRVREREKHGFSVPIDEWFRRDLDSINKWLTEEKISPVPFVDLEEVDKLRINHKKQKRDNSNVLWKVINYVAWYHTFVDGCN